MPTHSITDDLGPRGRSAAMAVPAAAPPEPIVPETTVSANPEGNSTAAVKILKRKDLEPELTEVEGPQYVFYADL